MRLPLGYFDYARNRRAAPRDRRLRCQHRIAARARVARCGGFDRHGSRHARAAVRLRLAPWPCVSGPDRDFDLLPQTMMSGKGMEFMKVAGALVRMNETGTEYVRGIPVVKVIQQTCTPSRHSTTPSPTTRAWRRIAAGTFCRKPQVFQLSVLNGLVVFLLPCGAHPGAGRSRFPALRGRLRLLRHLLGGHPTAMAGLMFMSEASQMAGDSLGRVRAILEAKSRYARGPQTCATSRAVTCASSTCRLPMKAPQPTRSTT